MNSELREELRELQTSVQKLRDEKKKEASYSPDAIRGTLNNSIGVLDYIIRSLDDLMCKAERADEKELMKSLPLMFGVKDENGVIQLIDIFDSVVFLMSRKIGEVCENVSGLKNNSLVVRQENISEIVNACIYEDRKQQRLQIKKEKAQ